MEYLSYTVTDSTIAELLGKQNFSNKESAILELVKNAYDARASKVTIRCENNSLEISDDGTGMSEDDIRDYWMSVGKTSRAYALPQDKDGNVRVAAGAKGIGRFALARLGEKVVLKSKKDASAGVVWETDWNANTLEIKDCLRSPGTIFSISALRDRWTERSFEKLAEYLSLVYCESVMKVDIFYGSKRFDVSWYYEDPRIGQNFVSEISLSYSSEEMKLICEIASDEFLGVASQYCPNVSIRRVENVLNMSDELVGSKDIDFSEEDLKNVLTELGDFNARFFFSIKTSKKGDEEKFLYKHPSLPNRYEQGIVLYRNAFSLSSYEGKKDWLGLNVRARRSPAAATHSTGSWRVRENQLSGMVMIDKNRNRHLRDLSNRQGLEENEYFEAFRLIILAGIAEFERYRQSIIRTLGKAYDDRKGRESSETLLLDKVIKDPDAFHRDFSKEERVSFSKELQTMVQRISSAEEAREEAEKRFRYEAKILNVFATIGLKASSIAHDLQNDRNFVYKFHSSVVNALKEHGVWERLTSESCTRDYSQNIPELLERDNDIHQRILVFLDALLNDTKKGRFKVREVPLSEEVSAIAQRWMHDYSYIDVKVDIPEDLVQNLSPDILVTVFDNLILDSIQQNSKASRGDKLLIAIRGEARGSNVLFTYSDNGIGLRDKYKNNPRRILEVHETTEFNGHGLGLWMLNNAVLSTGGEVVDIPVSAEGFRISFSLGGDLK